MTKICPQGGIRRREQ